MLKIFNAQCAIYNEVVFSNDTRLRMKDDLYIYLYILVGLITLVKYGNKMSHIARKPVFGVSDRTDTNRPVHPQKKAETLNYLTRDARKPVFGVSDQV